MPRHLHQALLWELLKRTGQTPCFNYQSRVRGQLTPIGADNFYLIRAKCECAMRTKLQPGVQLRMQQHLMDIGIKKVSITGKSWCYDIGLILFVEGHL